MTAIGRSGSGGVSKAGVGVHRRGYALGAEVSGVDASKPVDAETVQTIAAALRDHIVVYLPRQDITAQQLRQFCASFGELDTFNTALLPKHPEVSEVMIRANQPVTLDGKLAAAKSPPADKWHSDYSYSRHPASFSFLLGKELPSIGGDTMFANTYVAYETLSPRMRELLDSLDAVHDITFGRSGYAERDPDLLRRHRERHPAVVRPLVCAHPETGRRALFINGFIRNFVGMSEEETRPLLNFLMDHATRYEFIYRHRWNQGDLIIWDNRYSLHYGVQDYAAEMRMMFRCSLMEPSQIPVYKAS